VLDRPSADADMDTGKGSYDYGTRAPGKPKFQEEENMDDGNEPLDVLAECISRLQQVHEDLSEQVSESADETLTPPPSGAPAPRGYQQERGKRPQGRSEPIAGMANPESRHPRLGRYDSTRPLMERGRPWWRSGRPLTESAKPAGRLNAFVARLRGGPRPTACHPKFANHNGNA
jgi:hypothetical protein